MILTFRELENLSDEDIRQEAISKKAKAQTAHEESNQVLSAVNTLSLSLEDDASKARSLRSDVHDAQKAVKQGATMGTIRHFNLKIIHQIIKSNPA